MTDRPEFTPSQVVALTSRLCEVCEKTRPFRNGVCAMSEFHPRLKPCDECGRQTIEQPCSECSAKAET